jgi:hypothetical protein
MPFIGRVKEPKLSKLENGCCALPWWTVFIRKGTLWMCPKCSSIYKLYKEEWAESTVRFWEKHEG